MAKITKILVVCADTKFSQDAVHYGVDLAKDFGAELFVLHVVHDPFGMEGWNLPFLSVDEDYRRVLEEAKANLHKMIAAERAAGLQIREMIREGEPSRKILEIIREEKIDLVVLLGHKEGRLEHFLYGHCNENVIRKMPCSILLVKTRAEGP